MNIIIKSKPRCVHWRFVFFRPMAAVVIVWQQTLSARGTYCKVRERLWLWENCCGCGQGVVRDFKPSVKVRERLWLWLLKRVKGNCILTSTPLWKKTNLLFNKKERNLFKLAIIFLKCSFFLGSNGIKSQGLNGGAKSPFCPFQNWICLLWVWAMRDVQHCSFYPVGRWWLKRYHPPPEPRFYFSY